MQVHILPKHPHITKQNNHSTRYTPNKIVTIQSIPFNQHLSNKYIISGYYLFHNRIFLSLGIKPVQYICHVLTYSYHCCKMSPSCHLFTCSCLLSLCPSTSQACFFSACLPVLFGRKVVENALVSISTAFSHTNFRMYEIN